MLSERVQRQVDSLLDEAEAAIKGTQWERVRDRAQNVLALDPENEDARAYLAAADRALVGEAATPAAAGVGAGPPQSAITQPSPQQSQPASFVSGRYVVQRFLGEGGKKRVYLAHDEQLDRDVAFALLKSDGLDSDGLARIRREAQAMGRLGDHPHIVTVFDIGDEQGQPYIVSQYMAGGSLQTLIDQAEDHRLPLDTALQIADQICQALDHAHTNGVIHRDLKPGNVWLTGVPSPPPSPIAMGEGVSSVPLLPQRERLGEGTWSPVAKLGDFGLAIALDRSRLTQAGMMVGTVAYMAPEQALGSEVTPRSDLYSLGCLLYELVTGRPPFIGDESVAIISQHLNTPPISPSWHVPDLPAGLEALIVRLLEKDAAKRPETAADVRRLMASAISGSAPSAPGTDQTSPLSDEPPAPLGPLYRPTFVGRENEVRQLRGAFDGATSGQGALVAVVGEPGIGKTAICEQLGTYVGLRGGKTLVGHCYEEGSLSLPYLPFVEALRSYVLTREPDQLKAELGTGAAEVARIVSEIRDRVQVEVQPAGDPDDDRWRLFQAVIGFLRNAAGVQPLVLVLEDLHWADRATLDLLLHVARNLQGARLLIIGTYRDVEVDRAHPLSATLAELRRIGEFGRVLLRGLTVDDVHRMINALQGQETRLSFAEAVHRQTEGNPLFVQEVLRYLIEEGQIVRKEGRWEGRWRETGEAPPEMSIPEGLRDVVGKRLSRLGERTNQVLSMAAVMGRDFRLDVLQKVAGVPEEELDASLKEAIERAIVEERPALGVLAFRFTHAFFRQTLYEEIFAAQRLRLHQQVARALEVVYARRLDEHASELAEHFTQSTDPADLAKALTYSELAAQRAMSVFAYGEAARHLEQALKLQDVLDPDDKLKRCDLLLALGEAMLPMEEPRRVADTVAEEAFALAEALPDSGRAARAAVQALEAFVRTFGGTGSLTWARPEVLAWVPRADRHAEPGTVERVYADTALGMDAISNSSREAGHAFLRRAIDRASELEDNAAFFAAAAFGLSNLLALRDLDFQEGLVRETLSRPHDGARSRDLAQCLRFNGMLLLGGGDRPAAEEAWAELERLAERTREVSVGVQATERQVILAYVEGRLEEAIELEAEQREQAEQLGLAAERGFLAVIRARALLLLGRDAELPALFEGPARGAQALRAAFLAHAGRAQEVRAIRERFGDIGSAADESARWFLVNLLEAAVLTADMDTVEALVRRLAPFAGRLFGIFGFVFPVGRLVGDGARLLGRPAEARSYYAQALEICAKIGYRPEIALTRLHLAELLLEHYPDERIDALDHLDFAIKEFEALKMAPSLERALALRASRAEAPN